MFALATAPSLLLNRREPDDDRQRRRGGLLRGKVDEEPLGHKPSVGRPVGGRHRAGANTMTLSRFLPPRPARASHNAMAGPPPI